MGALTGHTPHLVQPLVGRALELLPTAVWNRLPDLIGTRDWALAATIDKYMLWNNGAETFADFVGLTCNYRLDGLVGRITCPTLCVVGEGESVRAQNQAKRFHDDLRCPATWWSLTYAEGADSHCGLNNIPLTSTLVYDWMIDTLAPDR